MHVRFLINEKAMSKTCWTWKNVDEFNSSIWGCLPSLVQCLSFLRPECTAVWARTFQFFKINFNLPIVGCKKECKYACCSKLARHSLWLSRNWRMWWIDGSNHSLAVLSSLSGRKCLSEYLSCSSISFYLARKNDFIMFFICSDIICMLWWLLSLVSSILSPIATSDWTEGESRYQGSCCNDW